MASRLADAPSPYLRQHADNPVDWWPWCDEAFDEARRRDVPVFLSIGYATCHWCHVMAHESFEDESTARILNDAFVCIKVDREERPDVDQLYMGVCQSLTGRGGWPLTVLLAPDRTPFFAGTYFPPRQRGPMPGLAELVPRIQKAWTEQREALLRQGSHVLEHLAAAPPAGDPLTGPDVEAAATALMDRFDATHGGLGRAPKFPSPHNLLFLLRTGGEGRRMVIETLQAIHQGGIHDHVGGGYHRYSTDERWLLPHFEKMLYDQAMLAIAGTEAWQATGDATCRALARDALDYMLGELQDPTGAFHSGEDADSEGEEGRYHVWTKAEIESVLGEEAALFSKAFGVRQEGNFLDEATRQATGANVLHRTGSLDALAKEAGKTRGDVARTVTSCLARLRLARDARVRPARDDKLLTDWNALAVAALARAGRVWGDARYLHAARQATLWLRSMDDGRLRHRARGHVRDDRAFVADHAYLLWALDELYATDGDPAWIVWACDIADRMLASFQTPTGALATAPADGEALPVRTVEGHDGALPSPNGVAALMLLRLGDITGATRWTDAGQSILDAFSQGARSHPVAYIGLLTAAWYQQAPPAQLLVTGHDKTAGMMLRVARRAWAPSVTILAKPPTLAHVAPWTEEMDASRPLAYLCEGQTCQRPHKALEALEDALKGLGARLKSV